MPYLTLKDKRIYYRRGGRVPAREAVVFIHGAGASSNIWLRQLSVLEEEFLALALDLPGHGQSEGEGEERVEEYAQAVLAFLDKLGLEESSLVGHSMGGAIALTLARDFPERVKKIVLAGSGAQLKVPPEVIQALCGDFREAIRVMGQYAFSLPSLNFPTGGGEAGIGKTSREVVVKDFVACDGFDIRPHLGDIRQEALVICGERDRFTPPEFSEFLHFHLPRSRLEIIKGAGHMLMIENDRAFNAALLRFLTQPVFS
jgi:pimeloyl-ACP methyl ester carboxylesterase